MKIKTIPKFLREIKKLDVGGISGGNKVSILTDGDQCFDGFIKDIRIAEKSINIETYIFKSDEVGWKIAKLLAKKAKNGVEVNVIYDSFGSIRTSQKLFSYMKNHGVEIIEYNPIIPWRKFFHILIRDHRKILVVDGKVAYVGGLNIGCEYAGVKYNGGNWRDTHIRITGPAVREIQYYFIENWYRHGGVIASVEKHFPKINENGNMLLMVISTKSRKKIRPILQSYYSAINHSKKSIYITNAYFVPNRRIRYALSRAARRGVDVRIIMPGKSNIPIVKYASRYLYKYYIKHGIKLYEYQNNMLHAKTAVIDGVWSTVGSSNLDRQSLYSNLELNVAILDYNFGKKMERIFFNDTEKSIAISKSMIQRRPFHKFAIEWLCYRLKNFL